MTGNHWSDWGIDYQRSATRCRTFCEPVPGGFTEDDRPSPEVLAELVEAELLRRRLYIEERIRLGVVKPIANLDVRT